MDGDDHSAQLRITMFYFHYCKESPQHLQKSSSRGLLRRGLSDLSTSCSCTAVLHSSSISTMVSVPIKSIGQAVVPAIVDLPMSTASSVSVFSWTDDKFPYIFQDSGVL